MDAQQISEFSSHSIFILLLRIIFDLARRLSVLQLSLPQSLHQQNLTQKWDNRRFVRTSRVATVVVFLVVIVGAILVCHTHNTGVGSIAGNDMVVELKGFRSRWQGHSVQPNLHEPSDRLEPSSDDLDLSGEHVKDADTDGLLGTQMNLRNF